MKKRSDFLFIVIPSFILILLWIIFTIFRSATSSTITETQTTLLQPISPNFDTSVIIMLSKRQKVVPSLNETITIIDPEQESQSQTASLSAPLTTDTTSSPGGILEGGAQ